MNLKNQDNFSFSKIVCVYLYIEQGTSLSEVVFELTFFYKIIA